VQTLAVLPLLPLATLGSAGFIGYGIYWALSAASLLFVVSRQKSLFYLAAPVVVFFGLSLFVSYMGQRTGLRDMIWNENAGIADRAGRMSQILTNFQLIDLTDSEQIEVLDSRLNQNDIVGRGVERHELGLAPFAFGATVPPWALIPRALWPDKPATGGGGELVAKFTGIHYDAAETSVGAGQVLEFYVNFGLQGVIAGFAILGFVLMRIDLGIIRSLQAGDVQTLLKWSMPGLTLMQPGGNLTEILIGCVAAILVSQLFASNRLLALPGPPSNRGSGLAATTSKEQTA
jgi:hypothetical protein